MPQTTLIFFRSDDGSVPFVEWLRSLPENAQDKCRAALERLETMSYELRRPEADYLRDGIYELRVRLRRVNYRVLYFFFENVAAVISHGIVKERKVSPKEIERALARKRTFEADPVRHSHLMEGL